MAQLSAPLPTSFALPSAGALPTGSMPTSPLQPLPSAFPNPLSSLFAHFSQGEVGAVVIGLIFIVWLIYTFVVSYHWLRYGHRSWVTVPILTAHVIISVLLFIMAGVGFVGL